MKNTPDKADYMLYEKTAKVYDRERFTGRAGEWGHKRQVALIKGILPDWHGKKVLEVGCGTGRITFDLASWGAEVTATDISGEMLEVARSRFAEVVGVKTPEFRLMSIFDIDIDMKGFDVVIMVNVLGRLSKPGEAIQAISGVVSDDCKFMFTFPCLTSVFMPFGMVVNARGKSIGRDVTSLWHTPSSIAKFCEDAGLNILSWRGSHYVPMPRILFLTLPFFMLCESLIARRFPRFCPSVFVVCCRKR
ncbi:MAG: methyltransferase domain-containing protein [Planctomycetota bacterium]|nr:methyltransferase domain-containing protein [Planctomycetota bacterium]